MRSACRERRRHGERNDHQEDEMPTPLPATVTTTERFPGSVTQEAMAREVELRIRAGAIRSAPKKQGNKWILTTEWNVIGGNG
jgi:hypothetical protein